MKTAQIKKRHQTVNFNEGRNHDPMRP